MHNLKRIRGPFGFVESPLMESEKAMVLECAKILEVSSEAKLQELVNLTIMEGGGNPVLVMKVISSHLQLSKYKVDCYWEAKVVELTEEDL
jgi:hypothetical protein